MAIVFVPKKELYYYGERLGKDYKVFISNEELTDFGLGFSLNNGTIFYDGIEGGEVESFSTIFTLFYNNISLSNVVISEDLKDFVPGDVKEISITYGLWMPHLVDISGEGDFGVLEGSVNLIERKISILLKPSTITVKKFKPQLRRFLKKNKEGYVYEYSF